MRRRNLGGAWEEALEIGSASLKSNPEFGESVQASPRVGLAEECLRPHAGGVSWARIDHEPHPRSEKRRDERRQQTSLPTWGAGRYHNLSIAFIQHSHVEHGILPPFRLTRPVQFSPGTHPMAARKRPLRSLSILLIAVLVNGSILVLVFRGMPHSGGNGRNVERRNLTSSRTGSPRSAPRRSVTRDPYQDSAKAEKNRAGNNAKPDTVARTGVPIATEKKQRTWSEAPVLPPFAFSEPISDGLISRNLIRER